PGGRGVNGRANRSLENHPRLRENLTERSAWNLDLALIMRTRAGVRDNLIGNGPYGSTFPGRDFHGLYQASNVAVFRPHRALLGSITRMLTGLHYASALPVGLRGRTEILALDTDQLVSALDSVVQLPLCHARFLSPRPCAPQSYSSSIS